MTDGLWMTLCLVLAWLVALSTRREVTVLWRARRRQRARTAQGTQRAAVITFQPRRYVIRVVKPARPGSVRPFAIRGLDDDEVIG